MKLTKKILAVGLSALLVLPMALPALAEDSGANDALDASKAALQSAISRGINYAAFQESTTAPFKEKLDAAKVVIAKEDATVEELDAALNAMKEAKSGLQYVDGVAGSFAADNADPKMQTNDKKAIMMDWTPADLETIDLSQSDLNEVRLTFTLTLGKESQTPDADAFKTGHVELKSPDTKDAADENKVITNNVFFDIAKSMPNLKTGENKIDLVLADFDGAAGKIDWANLQQMRMYIDSNDKYDGTFSMELTDIRVIDETPEDYVPEQGVVISFKDNKTYAHTGGTAKDLRTDWVTSTTVDIDGKDLSNMFLKVDFTLTNDTGLADADVFMAGYFRLRSADDVGAKPPAGENNIGASIRTLLENKIIEQPVTGKNSVKIPLTAFTDTTGTMDWATLNRFCMYFDSLPADQDAGKVTLKFDSIRVVDENEELADGVLGVFKDDATHESAEKLLQTDWTKAGKQIDVSENLDNTYLHVKFTLTGGSADAFKTGYFRLRSPNTDASKNETTNPEGENNVGYSIANLKNPLVVGVNEMLIPLNSSDDVKGTIDWTKIEQFRVYINLPENTPACTLKFDTIEIVDKTVDNDPTIVGLFTGAQGNYTASGNKSLELSWVDADAAINVKDSDKDETYLHIKMNMTNTSGVADTEAFKTGKILLASATGDNENSVMVDIAKQGIALVSGPNELKLPLSAFETEKGTIDWANVTKFRLFIDSTNQIEGATGMAIELVEVVDPSQTGDEPDPDPVYTLGDVDGKNGINAADALLVLQHITKKITLDENAQLAANVDGDTKISSNDALLILQYTTKKITSFPAQDKK